MFNIFGFHKMCVLKVNKKTSFSQEICRFHCKRYYVLSMHITPLDPVIQMH